MSVSRVDVNGKTILDLTGDTVTAGTLMKGVTAHSASGAKVVGTMDLSTKQDKIETVGILEGIGDGEVKAAEVVDASADEVPNGLLKGSGGAIVAATPGTDYMPPVPVTTSDNGKFLRVVNGAWKAASISSANGGSF